MQNVHANTAGVNIEFATEEFLSGSSVLCPTCGRETTLFVSPEARPDYQTPELESIQLETSQIVNCPCQHCFEPIGFDASELVEENSLVPCPHCGVETKLFISPPADDSNCATPVSGDTIRQSEADSLALVEARKAEREAQLKQIHEIANRKLIYYNLDTLKLEGDSVKIHKRGFANALAAGMNGERTIQISFLTSVQMKPAGLLTPGYILFSYAGSKPFMGGIIDATQDPDAFLFGRDQNRDVAEFKTLVEKKMREARQPVVANNSKSSLADELRSLAELKRQGVLTAEEFEAAKKKLLT